jgi:hypothetical protein
MRATSRKRKLLFHSALLCERNISQLERREESWGGANIDFPFVIIGSSMSSPRALFSVETIKGNAISPLRRVESANEIVVTGEGFSALPSLVALRVKREVNPTEICL